MRYMILHVLALIRDPDSKYYSLHQTVSIFFNKEKQSSFLWKLNKAKSRIIIAITQVNQIPRKSQLHLYFTSSTFQLFNRFMRSSIPCITNLSIGTVNFQLLDNKGVAQPVDNFFCHLASGYASLSIFVGYPSSSHLCQLSWVQAHQARVKKKEKKTYFLIIVLEIFYITLHFLVQIITCVCTLLQITPLNLKSQGISSNLKLQQLIMQIMTKIKLYLVASHIFILKKR